MIPFIISVIPLIIIILLIFTSCVKIVPQSRAYVITRLGGVLHCLERGPENQGPLHRPGRQECFPEGASC